MNGVSIYIFMCGVVAYHESEDVAPSYKSLVTDDSKLDTFL